jgi:putative flippase GtrA
MTERGSRSSVLGFHKERDRSEFSRWMKFNLVGGVGIGVQLAALAVFGSLLRLNYLLATVLAVETAVIHNFVWHERFTWADHCAPGLMLSLRRLAKFNLSNGLVSIIGNLVFMRIMVGVFDVHYFTANLIAISVCSCINFALSDCFVFSSNTSG